jgi:hypothetical protein
VTSLLVISAICASCAAGIAYALLDGMELLGRLCAVVGISLALTLLLLVLYQDDAVQAQEQMSAPAISQSASTATSHGAP